MIDVGTQTRSRMAENDALIQDLIATTGAEYGGTVTTHKRGARLNVQGLARKDERLMRCLPAPAGYSYVSCDLSAGEPTVIAHYSRDKNYYAATFGMVGKEPYYDKDVLQISSIYAMVASVSPIGKAKMREIFNTSFGGKPFPAAFVDDPDLVKKCDPAFYALHKIFCLGLGYSMGPRKLVTSAYDAGHVIAFATAKEFFNKYWWLYGDVAKLGKILQAKYARDKALINPFGYRLVPDKDYKSLNYYIQSSVSGIMHILCAKYFALCSFAVFVTVIHDEIMMLVPTSRLEEAEALMSEAEASLNEDLGWRVNIRVGWKAGKDMYEAK